MRFKLPYVVRRKKRKGGYDYYYRRHVGWKNGKKTHRHDRLPSDPETQHFREEYDRIHNSYENSSEPLNKPGTLKALWVDYSENCTQNLGERTKKDYHKWWAAIEVQLGRLYVTDLDRPFIIRLRDKLADTPTKANHTLQLLSVLMNRAVDIGLRKDNPVKGVRRLKGGPGHRPWEEWEIDIFRRHWAPDTLQRVAFEAHLNLGARGGDVRRLTVNQIREGYVTFTQSKTGERVVLPIISDFREVIEPWLKTLDGLTVFPNRSGKAYTADGWTHLLGDAFRDAGLKGVTVHGLRYTAAARLHEAGVDIETVKAWTGHSTEAMARKYAASKKRTSAAVLKMERKD